jgi:nifR3 family TIM-barrel protein
MRIGNVVIDPPVVLAPMSGINDRTFRLLCREHGAGAVWTGLVSANALRFGSDKTLDLLHFASAELPVCAQVFGAEPEIVAAAAAAAERHGAAIIDVNMGCSVAKVLKARAGVALMADPRRAEAVVRACVESVRTPVTVKMRSGWRDRGENVVQIALRCERAGAAGLIIHPREATQGFRGSPDWSLIAAVKEAVAVPVVGNGDVHSAVDAVRMRDQTGCDAIMVGRAALGYPWIFREIAAALKGEEIPPAPSIEERIALAARHVRLAVADRGPKVGVQEMRKHISWYLRGMPMARTLRERANHAPTEAELLALLAEAAAGTSQAAARL